MRSTWSRFACAMVLLGALAGGSSVAYAQIRLYAPVPPADTWTSFVNDFVETYFQYHPAFAVQEGRHEFDGKLPNWSPTALDKLSEWLHNERRKAQSFDPAQLSKAHRFERSYLISQIESDLFWLEEADWPYKNPDFYSWSLDPGVYITRDYAPLDQRMRAYIHYAQAVPTAVRQIESNLDTPLPRTYVAFGRTVFGGMASYYENDVPKVFAAVQDEALQQQFKEANAGAIKAMKDLDAWFAKQSQHANDHFALEAGRFREMLRATELVDMPIAHLKQLGEQDLERNLTALKKACAAYAPGLSVKECVAKVQADKPANGPVAAAKQQLVELKQFVIDHNVVSIPDSEQAEVRASPPYQRWNSAYIDIPGPFDKNLPSIYYIAPPSPDWSQADREAYIPGKADLLFTSVHEVWPGHFLQFLHAQRVQSAVGRIFWDYGFGEGWAHYSEEMMWEEGLGNGDPEIHIGELLNALLRDVRFLSSIGMHTEGMTVKQSEQMFREKAFQDPANARQQAARGTFDPAYLNYTLGKLMIRKLRHDWCATRGGKKAWHDFHDQFLSYGSPPIPLIRKAMLGPDAGPPL